MGKLNHILADGGQELAGERQHPPHSSGHPQDFLRVGAGAIARARVLGWGP